MVEEVETVKDASNNGADQQMPARSVLIVQLSKRYGGADVRVLDMARAMHGKRPYMVATLGKSPLWEKLHAAGLNALPLPYSRSDPRHLFALRKMIKDEGYQVVDAHNPQSQVWGLLAGYLAKVPKLISTVHTVYRVAHVGRGPLHELALRLNRRWGCRFVTVSQSIYDYLLALGTQPERVMISYNGMQPLNKPENAGIRHALGWTSDHYVITNVARLAPVKGQSNLLQAMQKLKATHPHARCLIVGNGQSETALRQEAKDLGVDDVTHFAGFRQDVPGILAESDLFCLASLAEGFPYALLEATQFELPLVVTQVDGMLEHLTPQIHARMVQPDNAPALVAALAWCIDNPTEAAQMGERCSRFIQQRFDPHQTTTEILRLYDSP